MSQDVYTIDPIFRNFTDVQVFEIFGWDLGAVTGDPEGPQNGEDLYSLRSNVREARNVVNSDTLTPHELVKKQDAERRARVERLAELCTPQKLREMETANANVCDLIDPPEWL